jgi:hypothetical protein
MNKIMIFIGFFTVIIGFGNFTKFQVGSNDWMFWNLIVWIGFGIIGIGIGKSNRLIHK